MATGDNPAGWKIDAATGDLVGVSGKRIKTITDPTAAQDAATKTSSEAVVTEARVRTATAALTAAISFNGQQQTATQAGVTGNGTMVAATGPTTGAVNQAVTAAGANFTHNIPVAASFTGFIRIQATIKDTTNTKFRRIRGAVLVDGAAGTAALLGVSSWQTFDDAASMYVSDNTGDPTTMLYGKLSVSGGNLVFTVTAHASNNQKVNVHSFVDTDAYPA